MQGSSKGPEYFWHIKNNEVTWSISPAYAFHHLYSKEHGKSDETTGASTRERVRHKLSEFCIYNCEDKPQIFNQESGLKQGGQIQERNRILPSPTGLPMFSLPSFRIALLGLRPYHPDHTWSHLISAAKQGWVWLVLGWENCSLWPLSSHRFACCCTMVSLFH